MFGICQLLILGNFNNAIVESQKFLGNLGMKRKRNKHPCNSQRCHVAAFPQEGRGPTGEQGRPRGACHGSVGSVSCPRDAGGELEAQRVLCEHRHYPGVAGCGGGKKRKSITGRQDEVSSRREPRLHNVVRRAGIRDWRGPGTGCMRG